MTAARLRTAAAKLREVAEGATPGPWAYNGYAAVFSPDRGHDAWEEARLDEGHELERRLPCAACEGRRCDHFVEDYYRHPRIATVPAIAGDTARGNRAWDAELIATMDPILTAAVADLLEAAALDWDTIGRQNIPLPKKALAVADAVLADRPVGV